MIFATKGLFIVWLVSALNGTPHGRHTLATIGNDQLDVAQIAFEAAIDNNVNPVKFVQMVDLESSFVARAKGDYRSETGEYMAQGACQYWLSTWKPYAVKYGVDGSRLDPKACLPVMARMIDDGLWYHWKNTGRAVGMNKEYN